MDRKLGFLLSLLLLYFIYLQKDDIQAFFLEGYNSVKSSYFEAVLAVTESFERHFGQASTIAEQKKQLRELTKQNLILQSYKERFDDLEQKPLLKGVEFTNVIAYANLVNSNRVWLERIDDYNTSRVYGAVDGSYSAGIVVAKQGRPMLLLNSDYECIYGVYVGDMQAPGVIYGLNHREMIVKYIPQWMSISVGDVVKTSGLDNIFTPGIPVGEVSKIEQRHGYKVAYVRTYADSLHPEFFYIIK